MSVRKILKFPDPLLREVSKEVTVFDSELKVLIDDMLETMYQAKGIGLAAPQVGLLQQVVVMDTRPKADPEARYEDEALTELEAQMSQPLILINPQILKSEGKTTYEEGCLSVPGFYETVERFNWIEVKTHDLSGRELVFQADGLLAICIQHELDHLVGKLFIDRLSFIKGSKIKKQIVKDGYPPREKDKETEEKKGGKSHKGL